MAAPYSKYLSSFLTTRPRRSKRTTLSALNKEPIPYAIAICNCINERKKKFRLIDESAHTIFREFKM